MSKYLLSAVEAEIEADDDIIHIMVIKLIIRIYIIVQLEKEIIYERSNKMMGKYLFLFLAVQSYKFI